MDWRKTRLLVLERDGGKCRTCGVDCRLVARVRARLASMERLRPQPFVLVGESWHRPLESFWLSACGWKKPGTSYWEVDHLLPREKEGGDEPLNLAIRCQRCHEAETSDFARLRARGRRTLPDPRKLAGAPDRQKRRSRWPSRKLRWRPFPKWKPKG